MLLQVRGMDGAGDAVTLRESFASGVVTVAAVPSMQVWEAGQFDMLGYLDYHKTSSTRTLQTNTWGHVRVCGGTALG